MSLYYMTKYQNKAFILKTLLYQNSPKIVQNMKYFWTDSELCLNMLT